MKTTIFILLVFLLQACREPLSDSPRNVDKRLPEFDYQLLDSVTSIKSSEFKKDKPIMLFIFDPECMYCNGLLQNIIDNINDFECANIYMISYVKIGRLKEYSSSKKLNQYSNLIVGRDKSGATLKYFELKNVPFIAVYDKHHKLKASFHGVTSTSVLRNTILN